ncbi:hemolysin-III related [compost metagenome]
MRAQSPSLLFKPKLRGASHHAAFYMVLGAGPTLVASTSTRLAALATAVYACCMAAMFGISALYHRPDWSPALRQRLRKLDHAAIYLMIAGTYTPIGLLGAGGASGAAMVGWMWLGALLGILKSIVWVNAPKAFNSTLYLILGWFGIALLPEVASRCGSLTVWLIVAGGVAYSLGAGVYALQRPNPAPLTFGYHEIFHGFVVLASLLHFLAIWQILARLPA